MESQAAINADDHSMLKLFFLKQIKDIYWAEKQLVKKLPTMQEAAISAPLKEALGAHLEQTREHVQRLETVFRLLGEEADAKKCPAMAGILEEGDAIIAETITGTANRDVGIIFAAQKAEHYEIATYGGLAQLAKTLGYDEAKNLLGQTLDEEKATDALLTQIAESGTNYWASREHRG